ncbi:MAG: quercetin 2,3-dioxygenase [Acidimicrobiaceae bacterium]|nr:quercetin 2,3-dioxygenase [Acidimicrobiaceae bacterium]
MSGPVTADDATADAACGAPDAETVEITESRESHVGAFAVRRALPRRGRRTVGAWCFVDHMGPAAITEDRGLDVAPHPHIGLQTVTWLFEGEAVHRDSLGTEQVISPGQLNLMTAGHGVAHSEEGTGSYRGNLQGVQLWVAQPSATRNGAPAFEHHGDLPRVDLDDAVATVLVGELDGVASPARRDTDHLGIDLDLRPGATTVPLRADFEHALVVFTGAVNIADQTVTPGHLAYLGLGREQITLSTVETSRALLFGGVPFDEPVLMWWNYVARDRQEIVQAHADWMAASERFGRVESTLPRIEIGPPPWTR